MNIYDKIEQVIVNNMTPTVIVDNVVSDGSNWKIETENTYWMHTMLPITVDGEERRVIDFVQDEYIIVNGTMPTGANFQLAAPHFDSGHHRKVNAERDKETNKIPITPLIYMLTVKNTGGAHEYTQYSFEGRPRILFLGSFNKNRDTTKIQRREVVDPMNAMAKLFLQMIEDREDFFQDIDNIHEFEHIDFGDPKIWGNEKKIFDQDLSGVERQFDLKAWQKCDDDADIELCPDVTTSLNGVPTTANTAAGQNIEIEVIDQGDVQQGILEDDTPNLKRIRINTAGQPVSTNVNSVATGVDTPGGSTLDINVVDEDDNPVGTLITNTPTEKKIEVAAAGAVYYNRTPLRQLTSYRDFDEGYRLQNPGLPNTGGGNSYIDSLPDNAILQDIDISKGIDRLKYFNIYGHDYLWTGINGGYYNPVDGNFYTFDHVLSDKATEFPVLFSTVALIINHKTGLMMLTDRGGAVTWEQFCDGAPTYAVGGFNDWFASSYDELHDMLQNVELVDCVNFSGNEPRRSQFNWSLPVLASSTTDPSNTTRSIRLASNQGGGSANFASKTSTGADRAYMRVHLTGTIPQP